MIFNTVYLRSGNTQMLVCHCHAVCDRTIRQCIREGAQSADDVGDACGAGTGCGGCRSTIEDILEASGVVPAGATLIELRPSRVREKAA